MTLWFKKSSQDGKSHVRLKNEPYLILNAVLAGVIILIMVYSGIFAPEKNNYPIVCIHEKLTGEPCVSCGLSHSISLILRGKIDEAYQWNIYGMRVFLFFVAQLLIRIFFSWYFISKPDSRKQLIILDIAGSCLLFFVTFWPFIISVFRGL